MISRGQPSILHFAQPDDGNGRGPHKVVLWIPGILSDAEDNFAWHAEAARRTPKLSGYRFDGDSFDYELGLVRWMPKMRRKVRELIKVLNSYAGAELHVVVHSNGGNMITWAIKEIWEGEDAPDFYIQSLHLIAPSCESDCRKNTRNDAVNWSFVGEVFLYQPGKDVPVKVGHKMRRYFGWLGWGHGDLSVAGFRHVDEAVADHFHTIKDPRHNHTSWFKPEHFEATLKLILSNCDAATGHVPLDGQTR